MSKDNVLDGYSLSSIQRRQETLSNVPGFNGMIFLDSYSIKRFTANDNNCGSNSTKQKLKIYRKSEMFRMLGEKTKKRARWGEISSCPKRVNHPLIYRFQIDTF